MLLWFLTGTLSLLCKYSVCSEWVLLLCGRDILLFLMTLTCM